MDKLFLTILNMSLTGAFVIAAICLARLPLKKAPKIISYCLWAVAGFRLVLPFSIESVFSLIPFKAKTIPPDIAMQPIPRIDSGILFVNNAVSSILPAAAPAASVNPMQIWTTIGAFVWFFGVAVMVVYGVVSSVILKRKMREAVRIEANIYEAENIKSPFVLGTFKPGIYLPVGLSEKEKSYILLHEQTHIRRRDHIVKFAAYFILCLHWFNPLVWVAFLIMGADMEMSCDERVLKELGGETKKDYSLSLLSLATERRIISGSPLAFGEGGIKERIKNVLNFKKPSRVIIVAAVALAAVLSIGFLVNRSPDGSILDLILPKSVNNAVKEPRKWLDYYLDEQMPWGEHSLELELPEYPNTVFQWTPYEIKAVDSVGETTLLNGMPVWNVYLADLTGDGLPEFCATISLGSGMIDERIIVCDYATGNTYDLNDRQYYDYALYLDNGRLMVKQTKYPDPRSDVLATGELAIVGGELTAIGIDRRRPEPEPDEQKPMTLEDVRSLAKKGDDLLFEDLMPYKGGNASSSFDYNIMVYGVEEGYRLVVHSNQSGRPDSVNLESIWESGGSGIDIRYGDINEFLSKWPVIMGVIDGTAMPSGITVTLKNVTDTEYTYGESYTVQSKTDQGWIDVEPVIENYGFNSIGYVLPAMESEEIIINWEWLYGKLPAGDYRIVKEALFVRSPGDYDTFTLFAAFTITE